jgi:hypothetical protein
MACEDWLHVCSFYFDELRSLLLAVAVGLDYLGQQK